MMILKNFLKKQILLILYVLLVCENKQALGSEMNQKEITEVERKYIINSVDSVESLLDKLTFKNETSNRDVYYDTEDGSLFKSGIFLRNRNSYKLEFKFNKDDFISKSLSGSHSYCSEHPFNLPLIDGDKDRLNQVLDLLGLNKVNVCSLEELLNSNNLIESININKVRKSYFSEEYGYEICIDNVDGLGNFLEIEYQAKENEDITSILKNMDEFLVSLNLSYLTAGYAELYWRKNNYDLYKSGKYLLQEDRV